MNGGFHVSELFPDWAPVEKDREPAPRAKTGEASEAMASDGRRPPALCEAPPLAPDVTPLSYLGELLWQAAQSQPAVGTTYVERSGSERSQPLPELLTDAQSILRGLRRAGLLPGEKVLFQMTDLATFFGAFWGCVLGGFIPVPLAIPPGFADNDGHARKLHGLWSSLDHPLILTHASHSRDLAGVMTSLDPSIRVAAADPWTHLKPDTNAHRGEADDPVLMLLTSGSAGQPKQVALSTRNIISMIRGNVAMHGLGPSDTFLNWIPHEHVGAILYFHIHPIYLECNQVHLASKLIIANPLEWLKYLTRFSNVVSVAPNFMFGLLNKHFEEIKNEDWDLSSVKALINAGEPIVPRTARKFLRLFAAFNLPSRVMCPSFGMSETCSAITWGTLDPQRTSDSDLFADLGSVIHGAAMRIVNDDGEILSEGVEGRLQVKGPSVFAGYHANPAANRESFTDDGWFDTGDSGFLRGGRLYITGRNKNVIIVNGNNFYCHDIEAAIEELPEVRASYTAACACRVPGSDTDDLVVFYTPAMGAPLVDEVVFAKIRRKVFEDFSINPRFLIPLAPDDVPKTTWGKIQHSRLKRRFQQSGFNDILREIDLRNGEENLIPDWFYERNWVRLSGLSADASRSGDGSLLLFAESGNPSSPLHSVLAAEWQCCIAVTKGDGFLRTGRYSYQINPQQEAHYSSLFRLLVEEHPAIGQVLYLWQWQDAGALEEGTEETEARFLRSLMPCVWLCQELARRSSPAGRVELRIILDPGDGDGFGDPGDGAGALLSGWLKSVSSEIPWLTCQTVHCRRPDDGRPQEGLLEEMRSPVCEPEIALRGDRRYAPRLRKAVFEKAAYDSTFFEETDAFYLITGGLGGVGTQLVKHLLTLTDSRFLCIGRRPLSEIEERGRVEDSYSFLQDFRSRILYREVDVCDLEGLSMAVVEARERWNRRLKGIVHLAGAYEERQLAGAERDHILRVLRPKVLGALVLRRLMERHGAEAFISFSSVCGFLGGSLVGAYAAAATFLEGFHQTLRKRGVKSHCFSWSLWDDLGISRNYPWKKLLHERGYRDIATTQGVASFLAGLFYGQSELWIGLGKPIVVDSDGEPPTPLENGSAAVRRSVEDILNVAPPFQTAKQTAPRPSFSFLFFSDVRKDISDREKYGLLQDLTLFADREGFTAVYIPERHFYEFGSIYANPAVVAAYLIPQTKRIRFRTAGVSLPLHHPAEVVEWWGMNDILSGGRVDLGFGSGWNRTDFVLAPDTYEDRRTVCSNQIPIVQKLWRGETVSFPGPGGEEIPITIYPRPVQKSLNVWILISQNNEAFTYAGRQGYNVFTMLYGINLQALEEKITLYRKGREEAGHDRDSGIVSLMLHTLIHRDLKTVREAVEEPFKAYIRSALEAHAGAVVHPGMEGIAEASEKEKEKILDYAYERYFKTAALFGTVEDGRKVVEEAIRIGVNDIACLMDFGVDYSLVKESLPYLRELTSQYVSWSS